MHLTLKTRFAILNFQGAAATWLQTVERRAQVGDWEELCGLVIAKFNKDQYHVLLKQFDSIKQKGSVDEYHAEFERLAHRLLLYNSNYDDTYFVTRFVVGLKEDIRSVICLHRPRDVDTASALALIQEEESGHNRGKSGLRESFRGSVKQGPDKLGQKEGDSSRQKGEDKLLTLKEFRRKNGLCFRCGEKWSPGHKCPSQVPLHVIEELLDALEEGDYEPECVDCSEIEEGVLAVDHDISSCPVKRITMKLYGRIGKIEMLILIDSGSVGTFVSYQLACRLLGKPMDCESSKFLAADGSPMVCAQKIIDLQWQTQGHTFTSTVGILPLKCFDMVLGPDWLESCSPMWVHWSKKLMKFTHKGRRVTL